MFSNLTLWPLEMDCCISMCLVERKEQGAGLQHLGSSIIQVLFCVPEVVIARPGKIGSHHRACNEEVPMPSVWCCGGEVLPPSRTGVDVGL